LLEKFPSAFSYLSEENQNIKKKCNSTDIK
jgi:hypothetical protein